VRLVRLLLVATLGATTLLILAVILLTRDPGSTSNDRGSSAASGSSGFAITWVASGFDAPNGVLPRPGDPDGLYVVEQPGRVRVLRDGAIERQAFADLRRLIASGGERGLLGVAFPPDHARSGLLYAHYTAREPEGDTRVVELRVPAGGEPIGPRDITRTLLEVEQPFANHNGGQLAFGPDGRLYLGLGDGGGAFDRDKHGQDVEGTKLAKLLALDLRKASDGWQTIAYGLRNPWRFSWDSETGDLYIGDVGQDKVEEVDVIPAGHEGLMNFGWSTYEGRNRLEDRPLDDTAPATFPVASYTHKDGCSITGGYVYRGEKLAGMKGRYIYGDFCRGTIFTLRLADGKATEVRREPVKLPNLTSFGQTTDGEIYATTIDGQVHRLVKE